MLLNAIIIAALIVSALIVGLAVRERYRLFATTDDDIPHTVRVVPHEQPNEPPVMEGQGSTLHISDTEIGDTYFEGSWDVYPMPDDGRPVIECDGVIARVYRNNVYIKRGGDNAQS